MTLVAVVVAIAPAAGAAGTGERMVVSTVASRPTLRYGSRGPDVVYLQQRLTALP
jgi:peptidoglycan hydrolase-like protein with peptidoglycan-binding domain